MFEQHLWDGGGGEEGEGEGSILQNLTIEFVFEAMSFSVGYYSPMRSFLSFLSEEIQ